MKRRCVKSDPEYAKASHFDARRIIAGVRRLKKERKRPTIIALEIETIARLKALAQERGLPYQVLMRMFILDGLRRFR